MRSYGDELQVQQGEDFNLDIEVYANTLKKIPYIVSSARRNAFWTITVASTKFEKNLRYVKTWWNEYEGAKFFGTNPVFYGDLAPVAPEAIDLGERYFAPTAFDYRDYSDVGAVDLTAFNEESIPTAFDYSGMSVDQVKVGWSNDSHYRIDTADNAKIYVYNSRVLGVLMPFYCRVNTYRGSTLVYSGTEADLRVKTVVIGYNEGYQGVDFFSETPATTKVYKYKLVGDDTEYFCKFNYETLELEEVFPTEVTLPNHPSSDESNPTHGDTAETNYLYYYTLQSDEIDPATMEKPRYYFYYDYEADPEGELVEGYDCRIIQNFSSRDTEEWTGQNYMYQITLVDGELMYSTLNTLYLAKKDNYDLSDYPLDGEGDWESTIEQQNTPQGRELLARRYEYFKIRWPESFQADIDADSPLGFIEVPEPILLPTKLEVYNNLRRLI